MGNFNRNQTTLFKTDGVMHVYEDGEQFNHAVTKRDWKEDSKSWDNSIHDVYNDIAQVGVVSGLTLVMGADLVRVNSGVFRDQRYKGSRVLLDADFDINMASLLDGDYYIMAYKDDSADEKLYTADTSVTDPAQNNQHERNTNTPAIIASLNKDSDKICLGKVNKTGTAVTLLDTEDRQSAGSKNLANDIDFLPSFNPDQFEMDANSRISLKNLLSKEVYIGKMAKTANTSLKIYGKYEDGSIRFNLIDIEDLKEQFPEKTINLTNTGMNGRLGGSAHADFNDNRALVMAVKDTDDSLNYGFYLQPKSAVSDAALDGSGDTILSITAGYRMNPLAQFFIYEEETGLTEFVYGVSRNDTQLVVDGALKNSYDFVNNTIYVEQVSHFRIYDQTTGLEMYNGKTAFTGAFVEVDSSGYIVEDWLTDSEQFVGKGLDDNYFNPQLNTGYAVIRDVKPAGTNGGSVTANSWIIRDLNDIDTNISTISLNNNKISLSPGTYRLRASCPSRMILHNRARVYDFTHGNILQTDNAKDMISDYGYTNYSNAAVGKVYISGQFTITETTEIQIEHIASYSYSEGFGVAHNFSIDEVYTVVEIFKIK